jgi:nitroimidazol reductase NimA-like FMN-containing flavoprotein (pyridoxamine 5'-phosphate oxidase superfamily)
MLAKQDEKCKSIKVSKVVLFNSKHNSIIKKKNIEDTVPYYDEMAFGEFTIESEDRELREAFEKIRESIENQI